MTSSTKQYSAAATLPRAAVQRSTDIWTQGVRMLSDQNHLLPRLPQLDLGDAVERYFQFVQRVVDVNHDLAATWAQATSSLFAVAREQAEATGKVVREQSQAVGDLVREQADTAEQAARAQADAIEEAEKEQARQTRKLEREQAKQEHEQARERYEGLTKAELSDLLAERQLPKTGNVDDLIERLVEADTK